jgi:RHS repeat-associated protein
VETKTLPDGTILSYSYHLLGFLSSLHSSDGTIRHQFQCNKSGRLLAAHDEVEKISTRREVDPFGNVVREIFPGNVAIQKSYDVFNRPTALHLSKVGSVIYTYDPVFLRKVDRFGTGGKLLYCHTCESYDLDGNLLSEKMIFDLGKINHHFDLKGRQTEIISPYFSQKCKYDERDNLILNTHDNQIVSYTYNDLSQLTAEDDQTFGYDSVHNRIKKDDEHFRANHLNELADQTYDLNGNQIQKGNVQYAYDPLNRLREATFEDKKIQFLYDPLGRRLTKIKFNKKSTWQEIDRENYLYDGQQEIGVLTSDGILKNFRVLGAKIHSELPATVAIELGTKTLAPLMDVEGNICRLIDPFSKKVVTRYEFTAFGEEKRDRIDNNPWRYAAKRFDPDLNIIYFGKRDYDPDLGRWLTTDPAGFTDSLNLYQFAFNNPFSYYDPDGEFLFMACIPFAMLFTSTAVKICVDAIAIGIGCWGVYQGTKYAADAMSSPYTLSEGMCYTIVDNSFDTIRYKNETSSSTKQKKPPYDGKELGNDPTKCPSDGFEWRGKGEPGSKRGSWYNPQTGEQLYPDLDHPTPIKPHWDYYGPDFPDGARLNTDGTWSPK